MTMNLKRAVADLKLKAPKSPLMVALGHRPTRISLGMKEFDHLLSLLTPADDFATIDTTNRHCGG